MAELTDPREMRKRLSEVERRGERVDGRALTLYELGSPAAALVRNVMCAGERYGWSGEDAMTALAYTALLQLERCCDQMVADLHLRPV